MAQSPRVSVVLPVRNAEAFLAQALESVLSQTFADFEIIAVDDGSVDGTPEILSSFASRDQRLKVQRQDSGGFANAVNAALDLAVGEYLARMDGDDVALPDRFERQCDLLDSNPDLGAVGGTVVVIGPDGTRLRIWPVGETDHAIRSTLRHTNPFCDPAVMIRRAALRKVGRYRAAFGAAADYDLWLRISEHFRLAAVREPVLLYRWHPGQLSTRSVHSQLLGLVAARLAARSRCSYGTDPFDGVEQIELDRLRQTGLDGISLQTELQAEAAARASFFVAIGQARQARELLDQVVGSAEHVTPDRVVNAQVRLAYARARLGEGARREAFRWFVRACAADPSAVVRAAYRGARELVRTAPRRSAFVRPRVHAEASAKWFDRSRLH
jgi:GT2 family glycosyltransferase